MWLIVGILVNLYIILMLNAHIGPDFTLAAFAIWIIQINRLLYSLLFGKGKVKRNLKILVCVFVDRPEKI